MNYDEPFPQANDLEKVIDLLNVDREGTLCNNAYLQTLLGVGSDRQVCYYLSAGRFIGFIGKGRTFSPLGNRLRELIVLFRKKRYLLNFWKTAEEMVDDIETNRFIKILPLKKEHLETYARLEINEAQDHNDPSDHIII